MGRILARGVDRSGSAGRGQHGPGSDDEVRQVRLLWGWHPSQWGVVVACLVLAVVVLGEQTHRSGVHWMRAEVGFVAPESVAVWQQDLPTDASLVPFAAAVQRAVAGRAQHRFSSDEATLHAFARQDASVRLADEGGQWVQAFNRPTLIVEVVDPDAEQVGRVLRAKVAEIRRTTAELQAAEGIAASRRIQVTMEAPDREQAAPSRGQLLRAGVVWLGVAGVASLCAAAAAGRLRRRDPEAGAAP